MNECERKWERHTHDPLRKKCAQRRYEKKATLSSREKLFTIYENNWERTAAYVWTCQKSKAKVWASFFNFSRKQKINGIYMKITIGILWLKSIKLHISSRSIFYWWTIKSTEKIWRFFCLWNMKLIQMSNKTKEKKSKALLITKKKLLHEWIRYVLFTYEMVLLVHSFDRSYFPRVQKHTQLHTYLKVCLVRCVGKNIHFVGGIVTAVVGAAVDAGTATARCIIWSVY